MPRGKYVNHKGRNRHFTSPEELEQQRQQEEEKKKWRKNKAESSSEEDEEEEKASGEQSKKRGSDSESSGSESESEEEVKVKGVENLIQIENPNRVQKKTKKLSQINELANAKPELSRREREQIEKQKATANYQRLHAAGKTEEARADLARLAIIKQQREEAAKRREQEKKEKEMAHQKQKEMTQKALGKRT